MLVTFETKAHGNVTMFGDVAKELLRLMGHSGTVPSALGAEDVAAALTRLRAALETRSGVTEQTPSSDADEGERPISLVNRAYPLIELLTAAANANCGVYWRGH